MKSREVSRRAFLASGAAAGAMMSVAPLAYAFEQATGVHRPPGFAPGAALP